MGITRLGRQGRHYSLVLKLGLTAIYIFNLLLFILVIFSFFKMNYILLFLFPFLIKTLFEFILLKKAAQLFDCSYYLNYFPFAIIFHIPYIIIFGLWGQFGKFNWKGESFQAKVKFPEES